MFQNIIIDEISICYIMLFSPHTCQKPNDPVVKLLTRPKNPISKEGDKPAGESSILKAF